MNEETIEEKARTVLRSYLIRCHKIIEANSVVLVKSCYVSADILFKPFDKSRIWGLLVWQRKMLP